MLNIMLIFTIIQQFSELKGNTEIDSFSKSKKLLEKIVFADYRKDFYCGCSFDSDKNIDLSFCGYSARKNKKRAKRIEWEHVVPAENFGRYFTEWRNGHTDCKNSKGTNFQGRKCAAKVNQEFRYMEADLYNLVPAGGEMNADRSNKQYGMIDGESRKYGKCDFEVNEKNAEPRPEIRGDIARVYFYFAAAYSKIGILSDKQRKLFEVWDKEDPVDKKECEIARKIKKLQGNTNFIIENRCKKNNF